MANVLRNAGTHNERCHELTDRESVNTVANITNSVDTIRTIKIKFKKLTGAAVSIVCSLAGAGSVCASGAVLVVARGQGPGVGAFVSVAIKINTWRRWRKA